MLTKPRIAALLALCISAGLAPGAAREAPADPPAGPADRVPWADARLLAEVLERVEREYVEPVDDHQLLQAAIRGMVSSLDPYSAYLDGEEYDDIKISSSGEYSGVGIEVSLEDGQVVVVSPLDGSAAAAAGRSIRPRCRTPSGACAARKDPPARSASCVKARRSRSCSR